MLTLPFNFFTIYRAKSIEEWKRDVLRIDETENEILCKLLDGKKVRKVENYECLFIRCEMIWGRGGGGLLIPMDHHELYV